MRKEHLTKYEQETIYLTSRGDDTVSIYTYEPELKKRMSMYAAKYPEHAELEFQNDWGGVSYRFKKKRAVIRLVPPYSEEKKQAASRTARENFDV